MERCPIGDDRLGPLSPIQRVTNRNYGFPANVLRWVV